MDFQYEISTVFLIVGYALFVMGVCSHSWKSETGYSYGLWYRCDWRGCEFYSVDFLDHLSFVRVGIAFSTALFTVSCVCLLIEASMVLTDSRSRHKRRLGVTVMVTATLSGFATTVCLGFYGSKAVIMNEKFPALRWGFASTGFGVMSYFLGIILRLMGPVNTWHTIPCLAKSGQHADTNKVHARRDIYRSKGNNRIRSIRSDRPVRSHLGQPPRDVVLYRKVSDHSKEGSCENLLLHNRMDTGSINTHHRYEEIVLNNDWLNTHRSQRSFQHRASPAPSYQPSPRLTRDLLCRDSSRDLSPRKASSLPPGISPGFYAKVHRHPRRRENEYEEFTTRAQRPFHLQTLPMRPTHLFSSDCASVRSAPTPPPPSPPLPPPPPPLTPTMEMVNVRPMIGSGSISRQVSLTPSTNSLHSFGYHGY